MKELLAKNNNDRGFIPPLLRSQQQTINDQNGGLEINGHQGY
jgi:hypothetical protein